MFLLLVQKWPVNTYFRWKSGLGLCPWFIARLSSKWNKASASAASVHISSSCLHVLPQLSCIMLKHYACIRYGAVARAQRVHGKQNASSRGSKTSSLWEMIFPRRECRPDWIGSGRARQGRYKKVSQIWRPARNEGPKKWLIKDQRGPKTGEEEERGNMQ